MPTINRLSSLIGKKEAAAQKRPVVVFYKVEEYIFNGAKQRHAVDLAGDA